MESAPQGGVSLRACKNALARLKLQIVFRLICLLAALIPLFLSLYAWRLWPYLIAAALFCAPDVLLTLQPDFLMGILNTSRAHAAIGYEGFFPKKKIDLYLQPPFEGKRRYIAFALLFVLGGILNIRQIVRLCADYYDITRCLPKKKETFVSLCKNFPKGLTFVLVIFFVLVFLANNLCIALSDPIAKSRKDPYQFHMAIDDEAETHVMQSVAATLMQEEYAYYVQIPFNDNGFAAQGAQGSHSAFYLAEISHCMGTQPMWEIRLTLTDNRSAAWSDPADVIHPIRFDAQRGEEVIYASGTTEKTLYYRDESGAYTQVKESAAPDAYRALVRYILLDETTLKTMQNDHENLAVDSQSGIIHIRYETENTRITIGVRESIYPFEASVTYSGEPKFSFETQAIRFDGAHGFTLPQ